MTNIVFCLLVLVAASQALPNNLKSTNRNRHDAEAFEFPFQISLQDKQTYFHFCGGTVINKKFALTAAHCVNDKKASDVLIIAGVLNKQSFVYSREIYQFIVHEEFNRDGQWGNDIAIIELDTYFEITPRIGDVRLPSKNDTFELKDTYVLSGWGTIRGHPQINDMLQRTELVLTEQGYCRQMYDELKINVSDTNICALDPESAKAACYGDDGGPLTRNGTLVGVLLFAVGCIETKYPILFTSVLPYLDWIKNNTYCNIC
ncbi:chymotrypsin-2-like [Prorops nasuta]|uniref:chymotrypsin-2-like n=1 Tax=Prorops nasuta TaxID=863751 RepID=UPI0034CD3BCB